MLRLSPRGEIAFPMARIIVGIRSGVKGHRQPFAFSRSMQPRFKQLAPAVSVRVLGVYPIHAKEEAAGTPGIFRSPRPPAQKIEVQTRYSPREPE